ncbi:hypothetical protein BDY24DRAFT_401233 [Mrakia frigida]|uniref:uncharacterized protein n=1 Tax=Mrakia frigida TaxID=29902 RepID=UPI003FCBF6DB
MSFTIPSLPDDLLLDSFPSALLRPSQPAPELHTSSSPSPHPSSIEKSPSSGKLSSSSSSPGQPLNPNELPSSLATSVPSFPSIKSESFKSTTPIPTSSPPPSLEVDTTIVTSLSSLSTGWSFETQTPSTSNPFNLFPTRTPSSTISNLLASHSCSIAHTTISEGPPFPVDFISFEVS